MEALHAKSNSSFSCQIHQRRSLQNDLDLSMCELELFIALQYVIGLYDKNHIHFHYNKTCGILIFSENMSHS